MQFEKITRKIKEEVQEICKCDCGGVMTFTGFTRTSSPAEYVHVCNKCSKQSSLLSIYPLIYFVYEGDEINENE